MEYLWTVQRTEMGSVLRIHWTAMYMVSTDITTWERDPSLLLLHLLVEWRMELERTKRYEKWIVLID